MVIRRQLRRAAAALVVALALAATFVQPASADNGTDTSALATRSPSRACSPTSRHSRTSPTPTAARVPRNPRLRGLGRLRRGAARSAGYAVSRQEFTYEQFILDDSAMEQTAPDPTVYVEDQDFAAMTYSGSGDVTAPVQVVDINLAGDRASTSGCEAADFAGFTAATSR